MKKSVRIICLVLAALMLLGGGVGVISAILGG